MMQLLRIPILVGLGGFVGSVSRYGLSIACRRFTMEWPLGTLAANLLACLLIGVITELSARGETISPEVRLALATGFCGGFSTMSTLVYETVEMLRSGEVLHAVTYAGGTFLLGMAAFLAGILMVKFIVKLGGGIWS